MSWSSGVHTVDKTDIHTLDAPGNYDPEAAKAQDDQWENALLAAELLARAVGRPGDQVSVSANGHANPDHAPRPGWSDESITLIVTARPAAEVVIEQLVEPGGAVPLPEGTIVAEEPGDEVPSA